MKTQYINSRIQKLALKLAKEHENHNHNCMSTSQKSKPQPSHSRSKTKQQELKVTLNKDDLFSVLVTRATNPALKMAHLSLAGLSR